MGLFTRIQNFFSQNKINILYLLSFIAVFFMLGDNAWADGTTGASPKTQEQQDLQSINLFFQGLAVILTLFTNLVGWLLSPEWTNGTLLGMDNMLKDLWLYVSNVVYFIFAMLFIWIALMNIIGKDGDNYKLKQAIPKFIVGVLIVPFSWFIVQFVISTSNVLTSAVLSIPYNDFQSYMNKSGGEPFKIDVCENGYVVKTKTSLNADSEKAQYQNGKFIIECNSSSSEEVGTGKAPDAKPTPVGDLFNGNKSSALGLMYVYTYAVMKIDNTDKLFAGEVASGLNDLMGIIFKYGFSLIILIAYALLLLALGFALFVRVVWLWFFAILSPIFGLLYFFDKKEGAGEGAMKNLSFTELISVALVPVYVSAALAFGFLFMKVASDGFGSGVSKNGNTTQGGSITKDCFTPLGVTQFRLCWDAPSIPDANQSTMFKGSIATLLGQFFGLIFLWMAVMAALKSSNITKEVVQPIADFGASVGQIIQKGPANLPIIPVPDGKGGMTTLSAGGLSGAGSNFANAINNAGNQKGSQLGTSLAGKFLNIDKDLEALQKEVNKNYAKGDTNLQRFKDVLQVLDKDKVDDKAYKDLLKTHFSKLGASSEFTNGIDGISNSNELALHIKNKFDGDQTVKSYIGSIRTEDIEGMINAKAPAQQIADAGKLIPSGIVKKDANTITINHFSGKDSVTGVDIKIDDTGKLKGDVNDLVKAFTDLDYKGKKDETDFRGILKSSGITDNDSINQIVEAIRKSDNKFFDIPKSNP